MLSKGQKIVMFILGIIGIIIGVVVAVPFRAIPKLNEIEGILNFEIILKVILGVIAILLAVYPIYKKHRLIYNYRENSKIILVMSYFPLMIYVISSIVNILHTISFDYTSIGMLSAISDKMLGIMIAELVAYGIFTIYALLKTYKIMMKFEQKGNIILDAVIVVFTVIFCILNYRVGSVYKNNYGSFLEYRSGDPIAFFIFILLIITFFLTLHALTILFKKDEVLVFYASGEAYEHEVKQKEYSRAYNDTLDDFELYFDDNLENYNNLKEINSVEMNNDNDEELNEIEINDELLENEEVKFNFNEPTLEEIDTNDSEEVKELYAQKENITNSINSKKEEVIKLAEIQSELDEKRIELRKMRNEYDIAFAELQALKEQIVDNKEVEPITPTKKVKKIVPSFDKMIEYVNTFNNHEGFKAVVNPKGNLQKFYIGKKMFLVMQSTNNDYRINFITTEEKFLDYLKSRPGELTPPKNLKDNYWVRLVNKGKEDAKFMRKVIKESVLVAEKQIADERAAKEAERKARAAAKAKERAAAKAAAKAASTNE